MSRHTRLRIRTIALAFALSASASPAFAQMSAAPIDTTARREPGNCFRGRPLPRCKKFVLFELGWFGEVAGTRQKFRNSFQNAEFSTPDLPSYIALELGRMVNTDSTHAWGGTAHFGFSHDEFRVGLKARRRTWLTPKTTLDLTAGPLITRVPPAEVSSRHDRAVGITGGASFGVSDLIAASLSADVVQGGGRTRGALHTGVKLGGYPAVVGSGLIVVLVGLLIAAFASEGT